MRLVQLTDGRGQRRVARVEGSKLRLLSGVASTYDLVLTAIEQGVPIESILRDTGEQLNYDEVYTFNSSWRTLPAFDHPVEPARCLVSGTGLTHRSSADNRNAMHEGAQPVITDSMRMYQWGVEGGRAPEGEIGVQPEWFYKGSGVVLRGHGDVLVVPSYGDDGGEEPEIAGVYVIDRHNRPWRVGMCIGNEFSDHKMEKKNYLYLAPSKLRPCAVGPELVIGGRFDNIRGEVRVSRAGSELWSKEIASGEANMCHSLANIEHHHFKYEAHRRAGDVHIHFYGASAFSFGAGITLEEGDVMEVSFEDFGRPLQNTLRFEPREPQLVHVSALV